MVLRIRALLALNRTAEARQLAKQALAGQPNSAFAQRLRSLLGQMDAR